METVRRNRATIGIFFSSCLLLNSLLFLPAYAYEGAGIKHEQAQAPETQPAPKLTKAPELITFVEAVYPADALQKRQSASVGFLIDIDSEGKVTNADVIQSAGEEFDNAAKEALLKFEFSPAEVDQKPAPVRIEYIYHFEPKIIEPPPPVIKPVNLMGRVLERGTRNPIPGATVFLPQYELAAETNNEGQFEIRGVPTGKAKIEIKEATHRKFTSTEEIMSDQVTEITAYIWKKIESGFEVVIVGERVKKDIVRRTLQKEELKTVPGTFGDPLRVLQNMPGMGRPVFISGALLVRGSQPEDTQVLIDGVPIPLLYHFGGGPSVFTPSFIDHIDFFPGTYGAKYGRAIGGVVDVTTSTPNTNRSHGNINIDFLNTGFYIESPLSKDHNYGTVAFAARRSYIDAWLPTVLDAATEDGDTSIVATPVYWDYQGRYDISLGKNRFGAILFGSNDRFFLSQTGEVESQNFSLNTQQGFHRFSLSWKRPTESGWFLSLAPTIGLTTINFDIDDQFSGSFESTDLTLRGSARKEVFKNLEFETGIDLNKSDFLVRFEIAGVPPPGSTETPPPTVREETVPVTSYATFAEAIWTPIEKLKIIPGLRLESYDLPHGLEPSWEPRLAARYELTQRSTLKAGWGLYRQAPQPFQLDTVVGNPELNLIQSQQSGFGVEFNFTRNLNLDVQTFYNWRSKLVSASDAIIQKDGEYTSENFNNTGKGQAYGVEFLLKHDLTERFYGWIAYTYSRSEEYYEPTQSFIATEFDQTHILTLVGSYKFDNGWELGTRFRVTTGRPDTPIIDRTLLSDQVVYLPENGPLRSQRGSTFNQLDIRIERLWTFKTWKFSTYLDVQNIYNATNPELIIWDYRYKKSAPLRGLPILPTFGVKGEF